MLVGNVELYIGEFFGLAGALLIAFENMNLACNALALDVALPSGIAAFWDHLVHRRKQTDQVCL